MSNKLNPQVDQYITGYPDNVQVILQKLRQTIMSAAPDAEEIISYQMPSYKYHGMLVHFAAYNNHVGFYPAPSGISAFQDEIAKYKWAKGSVQFPLDQPIPYGLIERIVKFRVTENMSKSKKK